MPITRQELHESVNVLLDKVDSTEQQVSDHENRIVVVEQDKADRTQSAWISPTLLNGWVNYGSGYADIGYFKDEFGIVHLRGMIKSGDARVIGIFNLPVGYRPSATLLFTTSSFNGSTTTSLTNIEVKADGSVDMGNTLAYSGWLSLNGISFRAEQ